MAVKQQGRHFAYKVLITSNAVANMVLVSKKLQFQIKESEKNLDVNSYTPQKTGERVIQLSLSFFFIGIKSSWGPCRRCDYLAEGSCIY